VQLQIILLTAIALNLVFVAIPISDAVLWDLVISAEPSKPIYDKNETPIIFGKIVNHADKAVVGAVVKIRFGSESVFTKTNYKGIFSYEFEEKARSPGPYVVNIVAYDPFLNICTSPPPSVAVYKTSFTKLAAVISTPPNPENSSTTLPTALLKALNVFSFLLP